MEDITVWANHGVLEEEREHGNLFRVSVSVDLPDVPAIETDRLSDTIDYSLIYRIVRDEMAATSSLLEHVAGRIAKGLLVTIPSAHMVHVAVSKKNPPVGGNVAWSTIEISKTRANLPSE